MSEGETDLSGHELEEGDVGAEVGRVLCQPTETQQLTGLCEE